MANISGVFQNVPQADLSELGLGARKSGDIGHFKELHIGEGTNVIKMDDQGFWMGGETFASAPFRADMSGDFYWNDGSTDRMFIGDE